METNLHRANVWIKCGEEYLPACAVLQHRLQYDVNIHVHLEGVVALSGAILELHVPFDLYVEAAMRINHVQCVFQRWEGLVVTIIMIWIRLELFDAMREFLHVMNLKIKFKMF